MSHRASATLLAISFSAVLACGGEEQPARPATPPLAAEAPAAKPAPPPPPEPPAPAAPRASLDKGIVLALAQFVTEGGKPVPGPARAEFLTLRNGTWEVSAIEDPESNVFHKVMVYEGASGPTLLSLGGTAAMVKTWDKTDEGLTPTAIWQKDFGGKFSRMRDAEVGDLYGDGSAAIAVVSHDQGVVAVLRPKADGSFEAIELDSQPDTIVHEVEIGDLDGDGVLEVYATPSAPNKLDGTPQPGEVVRYVPARGEGRVVVAALGDRHAKEILVEDVDGDGRDELYVAVEGHVDENKQLVDPVEIIRFDADTPADGGSAVAIIDDRLTRFLTAGDVDGDGTKELVAATFSKGVWLFRPQGDPHEMWVGELVDADSSGFEHAALLTDLDGDGLDELYVASDRHKEVRRYTWSGGGLERETIYTRPDDRPIFTWNLMPVEIGLVP